MRAAQIFFAEAVAQSESFFPFLVSQCDAFRIITLYSQQHGVVEAVLGTLEARDESDIGVYI